ncbi:hypothetical protein [Sporolactobacillus putidus]|uniref:Uncharacterized protein n=1 Tax=Sporolactobacillus putidus TaxID=492735 RepID=A0A917S9K3_9BACL|nr:hypothetical protein [Sporolactobacillus putidus]GGL65959.1 hypothetical protein GCM10007968_32460 [Sporolactobacillus putidus]
MIPEKVEYRLADYYFMGDMEEDLEIRLSGALIDAIIKSNETISDDELVKIVIKLINEYLDSRRPDDE